MDLAWPQDAVALFGGEFHLLAFLLPPLPQLLQVSTLVHVTQVETGFPLCLRHLCAEPLLQHRLLVGQPLTQVGPLEPVQVLQTDGRTDVLASISTAAPMFQLHLDNTAIIFISPERS